VPLVDLRDCRLFVSATERMAADERARALPVGGDTAFSGGKWLILGNLVTRLAGVGDDVGMFRDSGWESTRVAASADLRRGEPLIALFPALTPSDSEGGLAPVGLIPLIMAVEYLQWRHRNRATGRTSLFPLAPRMIIALTNQRLVIWTARRRWRLGNLLGDVSRERIIQATAPTTGSGWRTVRIYLANEPTVPIKVPSVIADRLASTLSGRQVETPGQDARSGDRD
jgi:hypothetical protein